MVKVLYRTSATAIGGREGKVTSENGSFALDLRMPKELGGPGGPAANPEQLFAAGYAACFESAIRYLANEQKKKLTGSQVKAEVGLGPREQGGFGLEVKLIVKLSGVSQAEAEALAKDAHEKICPYSHATRNNIDVEVVVEPG